MLPLLAIDFEASCLPVHGKSFPIEVGVAAADGWSRFWLIKPDPQWTNWTWTSKAETLHGICRDQLEREGLPAAQVIADLNVVARGRHVISDHSLDQGWLTTLSHAAGIQPAFRIAHIADLLDRHRPTPVRINAALDRADRLAPQRHKARMDALWLAYLADGLTGNLDQTQERPLFAWNQPSGILSVLSAEQRERQT